MSTYTVVVRTIHNDDDDMAIISVEDDDEDYDVEALVESFRERLHDHGYTVEVQDNIYLTCSTLETIFKQYLEVPALRPDAAAPHATNESVIAQAPPYVRDDLRRLAERGLVLHADEGGWTATGRQASGNHLALYLELTGYAVALDGDSNGEGLVDLNDPAALDRTVAWISGRST